MSRDLTPSETYAFWQQIEKQGGESLLDSMESTIFVYGEKSSPLYSEESMENRRQYPLLGGLFARHFDDLYALLSQTEAGLNLLQKIENEVDTIIKTKSGNEHSYVFRWFVGDLDPGFYESRENDRLFFEAIQDELAYCPNIDPSKITDSARVSVIWDSFGIAVDLNYSYSEAEGWGESVLCFCEPYDDGTPNEDVWDEAQQVGGFLRDRYGLPLDVEKSASLTNAYRSLNETIADAEKRKTKTGPTGPGDKENFKLLPNHQTPPSR